ncbi:MAG TPA: carboxypeptidase regulatory-like domain-containing protein [Pyrinomonadaceae bacterium]|nr:carboxypeptidase regulatory-like domain-containing protein [Pyrinomonadaceae bacterium]
MFRKFIYTLLIATISGFTFLNASAQTAPISGKVEIKKADGSVEPVAGALVEVFRTDIKASGPTAKTDKKGIFNFAGLPLGAVYVISVSAPGAQPTYYPNVRAGDMDLKIEMSPGDGRRLTPDEVREYLARTGAAAGGEMTEEQKKAQAEYEAKVKEIQAKNEKIKQETAIIQAALKEGNDAFQAKNFELAVAKYDEGIAANPTFAGSAPVLLNNKGAALRELAVRKFNDNVKNPDASARLEAFKAVKDYLSRAVEGYKQSLEILNAAAPNDIAGQLKQSQTYTALRGIKDTFRLMVQTEQVDESKLEIAKTYLPVYFENEQSAEAKEQAKTLMADLYRVAGNPEQAIIEYRKVLETSPDNLDAMAGLGLSLVNIGYVNNNKEQLQEGANILQKYASAAPDGHKYKQDALALIQNLKEEQKITPQKAAPKKKGN